MEKRCKFQFQKGAIKSIFGLSKGKQIGLFQFQKGAIKSLLKLFAILCWRSFNSKKVQLRVKVAEESSAIAMFQFQKGAIKSRSRNIYRF